MGYVPPPTPQHGLEEGPVLLKDGRTAFLRRANPKDLPLFVEFLRRLSPESLRMRFFSPISPEKAAELLLSAKPEEEKVTLVVLAGDPPRMVATGEYVRLKGEDTAEVAFLVDDAFQGKGLGTLLLERLALIAAKR
ncbi:MAG: GNAT family N-acetyltransferase, partial [Thermus caldifontis]